MLKQEEIDRLVWRIAARLQPRQIILFGSYVKGSATHRSDLDLFVIKETSMPMNRRIDDLKPMLASLLTPVDVHVYTPEEVDEYRKDPFSFVASVLTSGKIIFER